MRQAFINTLVKLAEKDERIFLLTADMGFGLVEPFAEQYPDRFVNVGVAEQNMIGVATGLALESKIPFVYSIANFPTLRCVEYIRNVCYHNLNVNIVAGNTGLTYGALGSSHHATEDIAVMRALPNMTVVVPCDEVETSLAIEAVTKLGSPCYLRLGKSWDIYTHYTNFKIGEAVIFINGRDIAVIVAGGMLSKVRSATDILNKKGINPIVLNMHTIKPIDREAILTISRVVKTIITVEEHSIIGGLGSAVAEVLAESGEPVKFKRMGIPDKFCNNVGTHDELLAECHLTVEDIVREVKDALS